jgi:hypothetical protein
MMRTELLEIASRFRGPPRSGNGGYTCGRIARHLPGAVAVRLKTPPPLNTGLRLEWGEHEARLFHDAVLVGEARCSALALEVPPCPAPADVERAEAGFPGFKKHAFPGCFVCGPERHPSDGLCIFPGPLDGTSTHAAAWVPHASLAGDAAAVQPEFLWSALDCTGAFAVLPRLDGVAIVLGELCASIVGDVAPGQPCVVLGWPLGGEGRKHLAGSAVYAPGGRLVAMARAVWIEVPLSTWG